MTIQTVQLIKGHDWLESWLDNNNTRHYVYCIPSEELSKMSIDFEPYLHPLMPF